MDYFIIENLGEDSAVNVICSILSRISFLLVTLSQNTRVNTTYVVKN